MRLQRILLLFFTAAPFLINAEIVPKNKDKDLILNKPVKENVVEGSGIPGTTQKSNVMAQDIDWEASGVGPDDEDGDVNDGSAVEGSGRESTVIKVQKDQKTVVSGITTTTTLAPILTTTRQTHLIEEPVEHRVDEMSKEDDEDDDDDEEKEEEKTSYLTRPPTPMASVPTQLITKRPPIFGTQPPRISSYDDDDPTAFTNMLKPGILAAITGGTVVGILMAILLVMFIVYRMRKKDEGSYSLDEPGAKHPPHYSYAYQKANTKEFYA